MDSIERAYLKELKNDNSTHKETLDLFFRMQAGDTLAREIIIKNYLLLVVKIANRYSERNPDLRKSDLIQEGNIGLITALEKFDPSRGAPFVSCARYWIEQAMKRNVVYKRSIVRLPENVTNAVISGRWKGCEHREISIDAPNDEGDSLADSLVGESCDIFQREEEMLLKKKVENILSFLKPREKAIVEAYYGIGREEPMEIAELAELYGLTSTRISQIIKASEKKIRVSYEALPQSLAKTVEIVTAKYGAEETFVDVTDRVVDMYLAKEQIKVTNKLGGDPLPGTRKNLVVDYIWNDHILTKTFQEGSFVKF